jgi:undecaprenyl-diphosphatase
MLEKEGRTMDLKQTIVKMLSAISPWAFVLGIGGFALISGSFSLFIELSDGLLEKDRFFLDDYASDIVQSIQSPAMISLMALITELGAVWWFAVGTGIVSVWLWIKKKRIAALFFIFTISAGGILNSTLKEIFQRDRPRLYAEYDAVGFSFPSGHAMGSMIFYGFLIYLCLVSGLRRQLKWLAAAMLFILILFVGFSRIYLSVHFFTDILAGFAAGIIWLVVCLSILEFTYWRLKRKGSIPAGGKGSRLGGN